MATPLRLGIMDHRYVLSFRLEDVLSDISVARRMSRARSWLSLRTVSVLLRHVL